MEFEFEEDRSYFTKLLCGHDESLEDFSELFDFRPLEVKRREFLSIRAEVFRRLLDVHGPACQLGYAPDCDPESGLVVDHLVPLSTNKLNKVLRGLVPSRDTMGTLRKVPSQSFGSNHPKNLILACVNCNSLKQNKILMRDELRRLAAPPASFAPSAECGSDLG